MDQKEQEAAFIRQVVANPDDDLPRLVYADWLEEHGREPRARLIRVQCQLEHLQAEERELIDRYGQEWGRPLFAAGANGWEFQRGFPEAVTIGFEDYLREHIKLNEVTPLSRLHLTGGTDDNLRRLATLPAVHQIRSLELDWSSQSPDDALHGVEGIRALAASPHLCELRRLTLHSHNFGAAGINALATSPKFSKLTHLALSNPELHNMDNEPLFQLVNAPHLAGLLEVQVADATLGRHLLQTMRSTRSGRSGDLGPTR